MTKRKVKRSNARGLDAKAYKRAREKGYRSGLEVDVVEWCKKHKVKAKYESFQIEWEDLAYRKYTPDFLLDNNIIIETKGMFTADDRRKHLAIRKQHPTLDIRFIFDHAHRKLRKGAKSTYADWCDKHGFLWAEGRTIPQDWLDESIKPAVPFVKGLVQFNSKVKRD